jgi:carboxyl-terminal processing protease
MRGFPLADGSVIMLVVGHVKTPCGRVLQRQYHDLSTREYYRLARADRDTAGRPSCRTSGGRTVYGGGGIYPDVAFAPATMTPRWLANVGEQMLAATWAGGYVTANASSLASLDAFAQAPALVPDGLADFRSFASGQGITIPSDSTADAMLRRVLLRSVAFAKWGARGGYRVDARLDPEVLIAARSFERARALLQAP